ncbi:MFS transporter [Agrococcus casei]|uniref:Major facilitator superfamily n=1 Tax=Agrococcus casei LMG 22410 TaxID=1255656 RepID=A0A1R4FNQ9_9MICO|nr:MFS transporter [Agrococcus casei]SJM57604.1 Major facilitator superfamily [Agrococcus casei LMG 22410]
MNSRRSWLIFGIATFAYLTATLHRSTLGIAATTAADRFDAGASALSTLGMLQLAVYAAMQIPVGLLADRFGPRALIAIGAIVMTLGQALVTFAPELWVAVIGRMFVGIGDAATFICIMRLLPNWFRGRLLPQLSQLVGIVGLIGQLLSAIPFAWILTQHGWEWAFGSVSMLGVVAFVLCVLFLADAPAGHTLPPTNTIELPGTGATWKRFKRTLLRPGTQLGFWSHFSTQFAGTVFLLMWGQPVLTAGLGFTLEQTSLIFTGIIIAGGICGPVLGMLASRFPMRRSSVILAIAWQIVVLWAVVLAVPEPPFWLLAWLFVAMAIGMPGSMISFDFARTFNPVRSLGAANGIVNMGGFIASFTTVGAIGLLLDITSRIRGPEVGLYDWDSFRIALSFQFLPLLLGITMIIITRRRTRATLREEEGVTVAPLWTALARRLRK